MKCRKYQDWLVFYVENELAAGQRLELDAHVEGCSKCRKALDAYKELKLRLRRLGEDEFLARVNTKLTKSGEWQKFVGLSRRKRTSGVIPAWDAATRKIRLRAKPHGKGGIHSEGEVGGRRHLPRRKKSRTFEIVRHGKLDVSG